MKYLEYFMKPRYSILFLFLFALAINLLASCSNDERRPLKSEKEWSDAHPDGELRSKPADFKEFAIIDRCDTSLEGKIRWRHVERSEPITDWPAGVNKPPEAVMEIKYHGGNTFEFDAFRSTDSDGILTSFVWLFDLEVVSEEPTFMVDLNEKLDYVVGLVVRDDGYVTEEGVKVISGSSVVYRLRVPKVVCPD